MSTKRIRKIKVETDDIGGLKSSRYERLQVSYGSIEASSYSLLDTLSFADVPARDIIRATIIAHTSPVVSLDVYPGTDVTSPLTLAGITSTAKISYVIEYVRGSGRTGTSSGVDGDLLQITVGDISALSTAQIAALSTTQVSTLNETQIANLTTTQVPAIETVDFAALTAKQLKAMELADIAVITADQIAVITATQLAAFSVTQLGAFTTVQKALFTVGQKANLSAAQLAALA
jgi:hypothetical protein